MGEELPHDARPPGSFSNRTISDVHFSVEHPGICRGWVVDVLSEYDVVNVHWALGLISLAELSALAARGRTLVFTMHDLHYVTGGCHYPATCQRLAAGCPACPQIDRSRASPAVPVRNRAFKQALFARPNVHLVAPSHYVRDKAVASGVVPFERAHVLRNPYAPLKPPRSVWPVAEVRLLLIADSLLERRKNMEAALGALPLLAQRLAAWPDAPRLTIDLVGEHDMRTLELIGRTNLPVRAHGRISDHALLTEVFKHSDILLVPSTEDNWPNTLVEACAYGVVPVVGRGHGCEEFVRSFNFGVVAQDYSSESFAKACEAALKLRDATYRRVGAQTIRQAHEPVLIAEAFLRRFAPISVIPDGLRSKDAVDSIVRLVTRTGGYGAPF